MNSIDDIEKKARSESVAVLLYNDFQGLSGSINKFVTPINGSSFTLEELYNLIDCETIEVINLTDDFILIIDEEGKLKDKYVNNFATDIAIESLQEGDYIAGNAVFCHKRMLD